MNRVVVRTEDGRNADGDATTEAERVEDVV
jgi:hypothetical protein